MSRIGFNHTYDTIISLDNLLLAWEEFKIGKKSRKDVQEFERNLMTNIISLHQDLVNKTYKHSKYEAFKISDPKPRDIHKAKVRDRLLHHAIYRALYPFFDRTFIADSYSCQKNKGTHKAINRFRNFAYRVSKNHTRTAWVLKCDIKKFFANIDHNILKKILSKTVFDTDILWLLSQVIDSFSSPRHIYAMADICKTGLPLGNLTSQLLANVYMNEFDQFAKRELKVKHYIRYADDFVILSDDKNCLENLIPRISDFLQKELKLQLHPDKVFIKTIASGIDFLGWVHFPEHRVLRTATKRRMLKKLKGNLKEGLVLYLCILWLKIEVNYH
ncbi:MAG: RNA-directed DNA polymerase (Reverse transcriptase) [Parcubacteria group bacterium GW2011_GWA2_36_24]|nr:MAG: RNA-directed DNA polymerase (Reverse transcriptase) [Parcubacteria group bacterium GW2011_GWA2_36_24]